MSLEIYNQILELRDEEDDVKRGRNFEILVREILPWDKKPPVVMNTSTEQLDGVFVYKTTVFIIECKAKKKTITAGSTDWEDYELKINKRQGKNVIGIFCSLGKVNETVFDTANTLNKGGFPNFIIAGNDWNNLQKHCIDFKGLIDFMKLSIHIQFDSKINIAKFSKWYNDKNLISNYFNNISQKHSSLFLRRYKHKFHERIYVKRSFEKQIENYVNLLKPEGLKNKVNRESIQILIVSDTSGSGKTTFSINETLEYNFCFSCAAENEELDEFFDNCINEIEYPDFGLKELEVINKPLLFLVDSLDEVPINKLQNKYKEIKSLFERLEELNEKANKFDFSMFPVLIIFTVREDYIRDWEAAFEGRRNKFILQDKISSFTPNELKEALEKYFQTYKYRIKNELSEEAKRALSLPVNLEIFSDAYGYEGDIIVDDIWEGRILACYFERKQEFIFKHYIEGFTREAFIDLLSLLAYKLVLEKNRSFSKKDFNEIVDQNYIVLKLQKERILELFVSEQILCRNITGIYNFRYNRFIEYLVAYRIIRDIDANQDIKRIDGFIKDIMDSIILSPHNVLKNIKYIAETSFPQIGEKIYDYYSKANIYLQRRLPSLRYNIANGKKTDIEEIHALISNAYTQDKDIVWDTFFILAAKNNKQPAKNVLEAFLMAWEFNKLCKERRWKIIIKLGELNLILEECVILKLLNDSIAKDWETYLGLIIEKDLRKQFLDLIYQLACHDTINEIFNRDKMSYCYANELLKIISSGRKYVNGDIFNRLNIDDEYIIFNHVPNTNDEISESLRVRIDQILSELELALNGENRNFNSFLNALSQISTTERVALNQRLDTFNRAGYGEDKKPFINYLFRNYSLHIQLLEEIIWKKEHIYFDVTLSDKNNITCFQDIINSGVDALDIFSFFEYIFLQGYKKNKIDDEYLNAIVKDTCLKPKVWDSLLIGKLYYRLNNIEHIKNLKKINRIICTLLSIYNQRPIGFGFSNLIQVVNNALEHYAAFGELVIKAVEVNQLKKEYEKKKSYNIKVNKMRDGSIIQDNQYDDLFIELFPELF